MPKEKLSLKVRFRRWYKSFKKEVAIFGIRYAIWREVQYSCPFRQIDDAYWWVRHRTTHRYHMLNLGTKPGYSDVTERLIHANFALLVYFMEVEGPDKHIDWNSDPEHAHARKEMGELYDWYKNVFPNYDKNDPLNDLPVNDDFLDMPVVETDEDGDPTLYEWKHNYKSDEEKVKADKIFADHRLYEENKDKTIEANLIRLIKIRKFLWT